MPVFAEKDLDLLVKSDAFNFFNMNCTKEYAILYEVVSCFLTSFFLNLQYRYLYIVQHRKHY